MIYLSFTIYQTQVEMDIARFFDNARNLDILCDYILIKRKM